MMKFELTLRYLAEKSGIPVWVMGEKGLLAYGVKEEYLADENVRARFLAEVASGCTEGVQVRKLSSGELYACFSARGCISRGLPMNCTPSSAASGGARASSLRLPTSRRRF